MPTMQETLDGLHLLLDEKPNDHDTRMVIADLYEEEGDTPRANAWRWLAERKRHPNLWDGSRKTWDWWSNGDGDGRNNFAKAVPRRAHAAIPKALLLLIPMENKEYESNGDESSFGLRESKTRREAEEKLVEAWLKWDGKE